MKSLSIVLFVALALAPAASAQEPPWGDVPPVIVAAPLVLRAGLAIPPVAPLASSETPTPPSRLLVPRGPGRPSALVPLYFTFAGLQTLDAVTTLRGLDEGGTERNPVIGGLAGHPGALIAAKAGVAAGTVYLSERLWKKNRAAAVVLMAALNGAYAAIVANNHGRRW